VLGAALGGSATTLPVSTPHWPLLSSFSPTPIPAPLSSDRGLFVDGVTLPVPVAPPAASLDQTPGYASAASGDTLSAALDKPVALMTATETPASSTSLPLAAGVDAATATELYNPSTDGYDSARAKIAPVQLHPSSSSATAPVACSRRGEITKSSCS
jgi:hypothetical protein